MKFKNSSLIKPLVKGLSLVALLAGVFFVSSAFADSSKDGLALSSIASNIDHSVASLAAVISDLALISGVCFVSASFFKFHQHKLNPTQVPLSQGITLLLIGAGLILFPTMLPTAKNALFGSDATVATVGGGQVNDLIGGTQGSSSG